MTPLETSGVASRPRVVPSSLLQARPSRPMFCSLIWLKGLNRCSSLVLPYMGQSAPSSTAFAGGDFLQPTMEMSREPERRSETLKRIISRLHGNERLNADMGCVSRLASRVDGADLRT